MSRTISFKSFFHDTALFFGYVSAAFSWLWIGALILPGLISSNTFDHLNESSSSPVAPAVHFEPSPLTTTLAIALMIIVLTFTVVILVRLPRSMTRKAETIVRTTSVNVIPVITHHKKVSPKKERVLRVRISLGIQLLLLLVPGLLTFIVPENGELTRMLIVVVGASLFLSGSVWFGLAYFTKNTTSRTR